MGYWLATEIEFVTSYITARVIPLENTIIEQPYYTTPKQASSALLRNGLYVVISPFHSLPQLSLFDHI